MGIINIIEDDEDNTTYNLKKTKHLVIKFCNELLQISFIKIYILLQKKNKLVQFEI